MKTRKYIRQVRVKKEGKKQPQIVLKDITLSKKYYKVTRLKFKDKDKNNLYVIWHNEEDFKRGFARLKRHESTHFTNDEIKSVSTKTHRYSSNRFIAKGFKP